MPLPNVIELTSLTPFLIRNLKFVIDIGAHQSKSNITTIFPPAEKFEIYACSAGRIAHDALTAGPPIRHTRNLCGAGEDACATKTIDGSSLARLVNVHSS
jgi:hypothetical protein